MSSDEMRTKTLLNVQEVQFILGLSKSSTYRFLNGNPPFRILRVNGTMRIPSKDFFAWIDN